MEEGHVEALPVPARAVVACLRDFAPAVAQQGYLDHILEECFCLRQLTRVYFFRLFRGQLIV